jgi:hypothetical protein
MKALAALFLLLMTSLAAHAQSASQGRVVSACGTPGITYTVGSFGPVTVDTSGNICFTPSASTTGGASSFHLIAANSTNATVVKASAGTLYSLQLGGIGAAPAYVKFYDKATTPTCNSDTVVATYIIPAAATAANGAGSNIVLPVGRAFTAGIGFCVTGGIADNDNTAVAAATFIINGNYK